MKINTKTRYGLRAMLALAMQAHGESMFQKEISENQEISYRYLDHLVSLLKAAGLLVNAAGRMSGYRLAREPRDINIYDIYKAFHSELNICDRPESETDCNQSSFCAAREFWLGLNKVVGDYMKNTSLMDLANRQKEINESRTEVMYYI